MFASCSFASSEESSADNSPAQPTYTPRVRKNSGPSPHNVTILRSPCGTRATNRNEPPLARSPLRQPHRDPSAQARDGSISATARDSCTRDFPYGLNLGPIPTRNVRDYKNTTSPSLMRVDFSTSFPSSSPSDPGTVPIGAFSSGQRVFCADRLDEEPRFPPFTPLQLHVT